jgi:hypothetical protein
MNFKKYLVFRLLIILFLFEMLLMLIFKNLNIYNYFSGIVSLAKTYFIIIITLLFLC